MTTTMYVNDIDMLATCGMHISEPGRGVFSTPERTDALMVVPALPGAILSSTPGAIGSRILDLEGAVVATSLTNLNSQLDTLREILDRGLIEVKFAHDTTRLLRCRTTACQVAYGAPAFRTAGQKVALVTISLRADDPYYCATSPSVISFGSTAVDIPLGTAPSGGRDQWSALIEIVGAATTPTLTYLNSAGDIVSTMVFTSSVLAGDSIVIDIGRRLVYKFVSGTRTNTISTVTAGYAFPALDPSDGYVAGAAYPKLKISSGSANLMYWKRYL